MYVVWVQIVSYSFLVKLIACVMFSVPKNVSKPHIVSHMSFLIVKTICVGFDKTLNTFSYEHFGAAHQSSAQSALTQ